MIKISPDIDLLLLKSIVELCIKYKLNGIIATNTTTNKKVLLKKSENVPDGGISGKPLFNNSKEILKKINNLNKNNLQIIGLGGIDSGKTAYEKLILGATAVQIYSGLIFKGPRVIEKILSDLFELSKVNNTNYES